MFCKRKNTRAVLIKKTKQNKTTTTTTTTKAGLESEIETNKNTKQNNTE